MAWFITEPISSEHPLYTPVANQYLKALRRDIGFVTVLRAESPPTAVGRGL
jgi:hypothetical protein